MHGVLCPKLCPALGLDLGLLIRSAVLGSRGQCVGWPTSVMAPPGRAEAPAHGYF